MRFTIQQASRKGGRRTNQDRLAYSYSKESLLMVLADGMGGHLHGEVAAQIVVQMLVEGFRSQAQPLLPDPDAFLVGTVKQSHAAILDYAERHRLLEIPCTTCVACVIQQGRAVWGHAGDSRLYHFRDAALLSRTLDHSRVQQLLNQKKITAAQAAVHPERNKIYNCVGGALPPSFELARGVTLKGGDKLLLCSDGLWGQLNEREIATVLNAFPLTQAVGELLDHAELRAGTGSDNLSAVALAWEGDASEHTVCTTGMMAGTVESRTSDFDPKGDAVSDDDIERAIAEIQAAIKKYSK